MNEPIRVSRYINARPEVVFSFFTSSEKWSIWQGRTAIIDARPGGVYSMTAPNRNVASGQVLEIEANRRISFTWGWAGHPTVPPGSTMVTIELMADGEGTLVVLTHSGLPESETDLHTRGWNHYLVRLVGVAEGRDVGPDDGLP